MAPPDGTDAGPGPVPPAIVEAITRHGPIGFDDYVELALYDEGTGFYGAGGGRAGRGAGDFLTSPEVGPLFGVLVGRALDECWVGLGRPDPFVVVEAGAGPGTLAVAVRAARPECAPALTWVLVERSDAQRARHAERLDLIPPAFALPPGGDDERPPPAPGSGPRFASVATMPVGPLTGVVVANELLDNLPFRLLERGPSGWLEVRVGLATPEAADDGDPGALGLEEVVVPLDDATAARVADWVPDADPGSRIPLQDGACEWLRGALELVERGRVLVVDYGDRTPSLARRPWRDWVRTYRAHQRGGHPLASPGAQDVTCEVDLDQLARVRPPDRATDQATHLAALGIEELVEEGRRTWEARAHLGDVAALTARSRVREAEALCDPSGLGAFHVLEWDQPRRRG